MARLPAARTRSARRCRCADTEGRRGATTGRLRSTTPRLPPAAAFGPGLAVPLCTTMKLLLAEDDHQVGLILDRLLTSRGFEVLRAAHVEDVAALIEAGEVTPMAIVEHGLPGGGGVDVC